MESILEHNKDSIAPPKPTAKKVLTSTVKLAPPVREQHDSSEEQVDSIQEGQTTVDGQKAQESSGAKSEVEGQNKSKGKKIETSSEEGVSEEGNPEEDIIMNSPPHVILEIQDSKMTSPLCEGSSCSTGGLLCGKALGNNFNFADYQDVIKEPVLDPSIYAKGIIYVYSFMDDSTGLKPENLTPSTKVQVIVNIHLGPMIDAVAKKYPAIKSEYQTHI